MPEEDRITKAFKRINEAQNINVGVRGGKVNIIYKQEVRRAIKDGIQEVLIIHEDITE